MTSENQREAFRLALDELRDKSSSFQQTMAELQQINEKATTKNRQIEASVDSAGRLTSLTLRGDRWRQMPANELCTKIIEVVTRAQDKAVAKMNEKVSGFLPGSMDLADMRKSAPDVDAVIEDAIASAEKWLNRYE
ncbi:YbaB/EbfC family nucleoid-associated protein [Thermocrispum municipale]|uniref:YbaB/EbfC family nucleoid-associated protein n=1 Tax=Thermocrispum municipale TaxID=37926 RepID=UPI00041B3488|nr:YbaB/EbfC family nucleoid-associated protein [Thermocrispum municipale]